jgi:signal peptidase I
LVGLRILRDVALVLAAVLAVASVVVTLVTSRVVGDSMTPTVQDGNALVADKLWVLSQAVARGDVVVVQQPNGVGVVKRVIGRPGDTLEIDSGSLLAPHPAVLVKPGGLGGWQRLEEPYLDGKWTRPDFCCDDRGRDVGFIARPITLPSGEYFVLGDNRNSSIDSRTYGLFPRGRVLSRVVGRWWPVDRAGALSAGRPVLVPA